jgi:hypothetical protein
MKRRAHRCTRAPADEPLPTSPPYFLSAYRNIALDFEISSGFAFCSACRLQQTFFRCTARAPLSLRIHHGNLGWRAGPGRRGRRLPRLRLSRAGGGRRRRARPRRAGAEKLSCTAPLLSSAFPRSARRSRPRCCRARCGARGPRCGHQRPLRRARRRLRSRQRRRARRRPPRATATASFHPCRQKKATPCRRHRRRQSRRRWGPTASLKCGLCSQYILFTSLSPFICARTLCIGLKLGFSFASTRQRGCCEAG